MEKLKLHYSGKNGPHEVYAHAVVSGDKLLITYEIKNYQANQSESFSQDYKENWGLWDFDVCEAFLTRNKECPYLEVQSSPLNQPFALIIEKPRKEFYSPVKLFLDVTNVIDETCWKCKLSIDLNSIPGKGKQIFGNLFCCLGNESEREYFALNINQEDQPDFHRPDLFVLLGEIK